MKKFLITLIAAAGLAAAPAAKAAAPQLSISYGGYTQMDACNNHDSWGNVNTAWGAVTASLTWQVMPKLFIGPSYTFSSTTTKGGSDHSSIAYHALQINARYYYWQNSIVRLYGHFGMGAVISHMMPHDYDSYNKGYFAVQVSPLGADVSLNKSWTMFGELGFGAQGLLQVGARLNF